MIGSDNCSPDLTDTVLRVPLHLHSIDASRARIMFLEEKDIPERRVASSKMKFRNFQVEERMNVINEING